MRKLVIIVLLLAAILIGWGLGERQPAWGQSPISTMTPNYWVYVPALSKNWDPDATPTPLPTPTSTPTPAPTPTPTPIPKLQGVGHHRPNYVETASWACDGLELVNAEWYYDWGPRPECEGGVPMIWDASQISMTITWQGSEWLQVFSEPDFVSQANMTPAEGATYYRQVEALYPDKKLVGPAVWYVDWLDDFWDEYEGAYDEDPRMDAVAIHLYPQLVSYYGGASTLISISESKMQQAIDFATEHSVPEIWVTEFTAQPHTIGITGTIAYMEAMVAYFESEPKVTRWAWFGLDLDGFWPPGYDTSLVWDGELTALGEAYR